MSPTARSPEGVPVHIKLDTGMGRWGTSELPSTTRDVVGVMTHLATADTDLDFARVQLDRFRDATASLDGRHAARREQRRSAASPEARLDAARCGIALYGLSPFGTDPADDGLEPVLSWRSEIALTKLLRTGESTGYGRRFVADAGHLDRRRPGRVRRRLPARATGTELLVEGERRRLIGTVSMDAIAVELDRWLPEGTPVTIVGDGSCSRSTRAWRGRSLMSLPAGLTPRRSERAARWSR